MLATNLVEMAIPDASNFKLSDFDRLPMVVEGNSKIVRRYSASVVLIKLKPTVYSFTHNRAGVVEGSDDIRAKFTALIYNRMSKEFNTRQHSAHAFLGLLECSDCTLIAQKQVETCNLEVRVKRYHIGSPLHRYRHTEQFNTAHGIDAVKRWTRFQQPLVCFDWRNPMIDDDGSRLSDEPLPDDYAALWMQDLPAAKKLARDVFLWLETIFREASITLVDICFFIDKNGRTIFGEISPDCMRARIGTGAITDLVSLDKDVWRQGLSPERLLERYQNLLNLLEQESSDDQ